MDVVNVLAEYESEGAGEGEGDADGDGEDVMEISGASGNVVAA
jgi:hypothetical protein